ncbi:hypothetical protein CO726_25120 [Bacillus fungorum]|uniref:RiboL-PSP-HEPN domain-containing protein n=1 Tax=Bacillus fungorum TaxID=2039284 RepID=A0A2G6Q8H2_9BACI|nr:hypothetical protein [Bacillus fungorum]PIE92729.1 hypothetical protein CO726_25120 [Bacillus fungorum]
MSKKIRKLKPKLIQELKELQKSRGEMQHFLTNFVLNLCHRSESMVFLRENYRPTDNGNLKDSKPFQVSVGLYVSSLVTCWETLFRDLFVFIVDNDNDIYDRIYSFLQEKNIELDAVDAMDISVSEYMSKQFNFQDLAQTCEAFNFLFDRTEKKITDYFDEAINAIGAFQCSRPNYILHWLQQGNIALVKKEIFDTLEEAFNIRHKVIHDGNFYMEVIPEQMAKIESCFVIFPQFITAWLAIKYNQKRMVAFEKNGGTVMVLTTDFIENSAIKILDVSDFSAKDYIVVPDTK